MAYKIDLTNNVYGHLTVKGYDEQTSKEKGRSYWIVECDCDDHTLFSVVGTSLTSGKTTKCKYCKAQNLIGQKFNRLTVIKRIIRDEKVMWQAQCDCGNTIIVRADSLKSGHTKSCGCLQKEKVAQLNYKDIIGQKYGKLTVIERSERKDTSGSYYWFCDCDCGTKHHEVSGHHLKAGRIISCGCVKSRGEEKISQLLSEKDISFIREYIVQDYQFISGGNPRFDFAILNTDNSIAYFIEYQGEQHFKSRETGYFTEDRVAAIQERDKEKRQYCENKNIPLIYINYTDLNIFTLQDIYKPELIK